MSFILDTLDYAFELPSPDFGNIYRIDPQDIKRMTRAGGIKVYASSNWPTFVSHVYTFNLIETSLLESLRLWFVIKAGQQIRITDHLNNSYDGFIMTPVQEMIFTRPDCSNGLNFEFMEVPV